jgi:hypothetical protein
LAVHKTLAEQRNRRGSVEQEQARHWREFRALVFAAQGPQSVDEM